MFKIGDTNFMDFISKVTSSKQLYSFWKVKIYLFLLRIAAKTQNYELIFCRIHGAVHASNSARAAPATTAASARYHIELQTRSSTQPAAIYPRYMSWPPHSAQAKQERVSKGVTKLFMEVEVARRVERELVGLRIASTSSCE